MTSSATLYCKNDRERRRLARAVPLNGLDFLEVSDDQRRLTVFFLEKAPEWITARHLRIDGGRRVRDIRIIDVTINRNDDPERDDCMTVTVDQPGDFSNYTLCVVALDEEGKATEEVPVDFDPRYTCLCFSFKVGCPSDLDCNSRPVCETHPLTEPPIDYLAKDFTSFRRLIMDRLALVMPEWQERYIPDLGITLVELLAYTGDHLSYYQDAVATEAYLDTARQRISIRRHARLVDYLLHEGCNARAWITLSVSQESLRLRKDTFYFITSTGDMSGAMLKEEALPQTPPASFLVFEPLWLNEAVEVKLFAAHNEIRFYTWSNTECSLPKGSTSATLIDPGCIPETSPVAQEDDVKETASEWSSNDSSALPRNRDYRLDLKVCDVLVFEEVKGPNTANPDDADPSHRHAVRLTAVRQTWDPLTRKLLVEIEWAPEDALPFALCLSSTGPAPNCNTIPDVSVARGNVLLVDHGRSVSDSLGQVPTRSTTMECGDGCLPPEIRHTPGLFRPNLPKPELTCSEPAPPCTANSDACNSGMKVNAASPLMIQNPRNALPQITLHSIPSAPSGETAFSVEDLDDPSILAKAIADAGNDETQPPAWLRGQLPSAIQDDLIKWANKTPLPPLPEFLHNKISDLLLHLIQEWEVRQNLLSSGQDDRHFVVEMDDEAKAHLRFGNGDCGLSPAAGESFFAHYRVGNGAVGNVGAGAISQIVFRSEYPNGADIRPRNPMPAVGGQDPEPVQEAKLRAPHVFRSRIERAITADDYAAIVMRDFPARVQGAAATLCWNGVGPQVLIAIDALGRTESAPELLCEIERHLQRYRRMGHDVTVSGAETVPIDLALSVCVREGYLRGHIKAALLETFSNRRLPGGQLGFFHPDNMTLGQGIYVSQIVARAQAIEGIESVRITRFERQYEGPNGELKAGILPLDPLEVACLDNDPGYPEHGSLTLKLEGGR